MSSPVVAAPFDIKSFIPQPPAGADGAALAEKIQAIIKAFSEEGKDLPTPPSEAEREVLIEKVKGILANIQSQKASGAQSGLPAGFTIPQIPAGVDGEAIMEKVKAIIENLKAEGKDLPTPPTSLPAGFKIPQPPTGVSAIPQPPADFDVEVIIERVKGILAGFEAEGKGLPTPPTLPEGFKIPSAPTGLKISQAPAGLPEGVTIPSLPEGFTIPSLPEGFTIPQLPSGPEGEAIVAKVKDTLKTLDADGSFKNLNIMEKVQAVIKHLDEQK